MIISLVILREGSEIIIFLYALVVDGSMSWFSLLLGSVMGLILGVGVIMYLGLVRLPMKQIFSTTSILLTLIAAGMAAKAATKLVAIHAIPLITNHVWNTGWLLSQHSLIGKLFSVLIGYQQSPSAIAPIFYLFTAITIISYSKIESRKAIPTGHSRFTKCWMTLSTSGKCIGSIKRGCCELNLAE